MAVTAEQAPLYIVRKVFGSSTSRKMSPATKTVGSTVGRSNVYHIAAHITDVPSTRKSPPSSCYPRYSSIHFVAVNINSFLIWWGVRGSHFGLKACPGWVSLYQVTVLIFLSLMYVRWFLIMSLPMILTDWEAYLRMLGDFDQTSLTVAGRLFFRVQTLAFASMSLLISIFCYRHRKDKKYFTWLKLFEIMRKKMKAADLKITEYMAIVIWKETLFAMNVVYTLWHAVYLIALPAFLVWQNQAEMLTGDLTTILWVVTQAVWLYYVGIQVVGFVCLFHCVAVYFDVRMKKLLNDLRLMNLKDKELTQMDRAEVLYSWLQEFDLTDVELEKYSQFWQHYFLVFYGIGFFLWLFQLTSFTCYWRFMTWAEWGMVGVCLGIVVGVWVHSVMVAARVNAHTKQLYAVMNRFCLIPTHSIVQNKMDNFVKKFSSVNRKIGFHCYRMFYLSHFFLYHVST